MGGRGYVGVVGRELNYIVTGNDMKYPVKILWNIVTLSVLTAGQFFISCEEASPVYSEPRTASITLNVPVPETRVAGTDEENAIHTLRVVILSEGALSINEKFSADDLSGGSVTVDNVPVGQVEMYVIANESSIGKNYDDLAVLQKDVQTVNGKRKLLIEDLNREYFPKRGSELNAETEPKKGLPMGWRNLYLTIAPPSDTPQTVDVKLERQVAKLNIEMNNTLTTDIVINEISFGAFMSDRFYFYRETDLDVPDGAEYDGRTYSGLGIPVKGGDKATLICYVYPSFAWKSSGVSSPYTIGFRTEAGVNYPAQPFVKNFGALNSILRNTQINIYATLSKESNVDISFSVVDWDDKTVNVPPFN